MLALCWAYVGLCWAYVGPCWAILGAMLGPCLGHLCWNDLKMPIFPPRAPSWSPKPNRGFVTSPRWNPFALKALKHRKKRCFLTPQAQNTVNCVGFSRHGAAPITFGYHRRPPARTRAPWLAPGFKGYALCRRPLEVQPSWSLRQLKRGQSLRLAATCA